MNHIAIGNLGEETAVNHLKAIGYKIITTKYRAKTGEIDIIARDRDSFVFIEVKTRRSTVFGSPAEAVTYRKQRKIINTALCYLNQYHLTDVACRFDIIEIYVLKDSIKINHIKNAFGG